MNDLFGITAESKGGNNLITPFSSSDRVSISSQNDITGVFEADIIPFDTAYEEYQIDCFRMAYPNEDEFNLMSYDDVKKVCDWIEEQNQIKNFPNIGKVIRVEPKPFLPSVRFRDFESNLVAYYFTLRITFVNTVKRQVITYD